MVSIGTLVVGSDAAPSRRSLRGRWGLVLSDRFAGVFASRAVASRADLIVTKDLTTSGRDTFTAHTLVVLAEFGKRRARLAPTTRVAMRGATVIDSLTVPGLGRRRPAFRFELQGLGAP